MKKFIVLVVCVLFLMVSQLAYAADEPKVSPELQKLYTDLQQINDLAFRTAGKIDYANKTMLQISRDAGTLDAQLKRYQEEINKIKAVIKRLGPATPAKKSKPAPKAQKKTKKGNNEP